MPNRQRNRRPPCLTTGTGAKTAALSRVTARRAPQQEGGPFTQKDGRERLEKLYDESI